MGESWTGIEDLVSEPLNECVDLLPETVEESQSTPKLETTPIKSECSEEILEKTEIDTVITERVSVVVDTDQPSTSTSITQVTTFTQVTNAVTEDTCDNLPSDDEESSYDEFDDFKDKRKRQSLAERLPSNSFYKLAPRVFIFPGAEVYMNDMDDEDDDDSGSCVDENDTIITPEEVAEIKSCSSIALLSPSVITCPSSSSTSTTDYQPPPGL